MPFAAPTAMRSGSQGVMRLDLVAEHSAQGVDWRAHQVPRAPTAEAAAVQILRLRIGALSEDDGPKDADPRGAGA